MKPLGDKKILVAVSGGIAAYKAIEVVSRLRKLGAEVKVIMTKNATKLVTPLTFGEISNNPVAIDMWEEIHDWNVEHIALATWVDAFIVVPATANVIGKIANGIADDMLTTTIMATKADKYICPAMNSVMYENPITQENINKLKQLDYKVLMPDTGRLACGVDGIGRLPSPEKIVDWLSFNISKTNELKGKTVIVTAGGTKEAIDPVRYIGNHSSGKMGYSLAQEAACRGAVVYLITAPTNIKAPQGVNVINVKTAEEMKIAVDKIYPQSDLVIMAAAVSDYKVANASEVKIKKKQAITLELVKNPDILESLGKKKENQILVGFAAETNNVLEYAKDKLERKNLDFIVANDVSKKDVGFNSDENKVTIIDKNYNCVELQQMKKTQVSAKIFDTILNLY